jgi:hypothetical protein
MVLSFPPHINFVGQFLSRLDFVAQKPNIHTKCLIRAYWFWKAPKLCFDAKKVFRPLGQILTFFVLTKNVFFTASTSLQRNLHFVASSHNFLTFLKKCCSARLFNIVQNRSKSLLLRQKSVPPAWSDSYIFCFD